MPANISPFTRGCPPLRNKSPTRRETIRTTVICNIRRTRFIGTPSYSSRLSPRSDEHSEICNPKGHDVSDRAFYPNRRRSLPSQHFVQVVDREQNGPHDQGKA